MTRLADRRGYTPHMDDPRPDAVDKLRLTAMSLPGTREDSPWGGPAWKVEGKLYGVVMDDGSSVMLRCTPDRQAALLQDPAVSAAPYLGKRGWILVSLADEPRALLATELLEDAYHLLLEKLPKRTREALKSEAGR